MLASSSTTQMEDSVFCQYFHVIDTYWYMLKPVHIKVYVRDFFRDFVIVVRRHLWQNIGFIYSADKPMSTHICIYHLCIIYIHMCTKIYATKGEKLASNNLFSLKCMYGDRAKPPSPMSPPHGAEGNFACSLYWVHNGLYFRWEDYVSSYDLIT